jgi:hypothetical protein
MKFMASPAGRITRIVAGILLIVIGLLVGDTVGIIIALVGLIPLLAGVFDVCVLAPLFGDPFSGEGIRSKYSGTT